MDRALVADTNRNDHESDSPLLGPSMSYHAQKFLETNPASPTTRGVGTDQVFLQNIVWPRVMKTTLTHDSRIPVCRKYGSQWCRPFPLGPATTGTHFIGMGNKAESNWTLECSMECKVSPFYDATTFA